MKLRPSHKLAWLGVAPALLVLITGCASRPDSSGGISSGGVSSRGKVGLNEPQATSIVETPAGANSPAGADGTAVFNSKLISVGEVAPVFDLKRLGGGRLSLAQLKGNVVLLSFWMSSCPPCHVEAPHLQRLHREYSHEGLRVVGITPLTPLAEIHNFIQRNRITYSILVDPGEKVVKRYGLAGYPVTMLIDRSGVVRFTHASFQSGDDKALEYELRTLL